MNIQTERFIAASEVFETIPDVWHIFSEICPFTYGDADRTLVKLPRFIAELESHSYVSSPELTYVLELLYSLNCDHDIYIDLEN